MFPMLCNHGLSLIDSLALIRILYLPGNICQNGREGKGMCRDMCDLPPKRNPLFKLELPVAWTNLFCFVSTLIWRNSFFDITT